MSSRNQNITRLSEVEYCLTAYFNSYVVPLMDDEREKLQRAQAEEVKEYSMSTAGILRSMAAASTGMPDDTMTYLRYTGKENSKTAEDYVEQCAGRIADNEAMQADLTRLAGEWRKAVVGQIGRERYDELSQRLGADLALAYVDYRVEQLMIDHMVAQQMPRSSFDYILRKGAASSLLGLPQEALKSPLEAEIEAQGEAAYRPSGAEKAVAQGVSFAADAAALGGIYSWGSLARVAATDVAFAGLEKVLEDSEQRDNSPTIDQCVSQALFAGDINRLAEVRRDSMRIKTYESPYILSVNRLLAQPMAMPTEKPFWESSFKLFNGSDPNLARTGDWPGWPWQKERSAQSQLAAQVERTDYPGVPLVIAPGQEEEYLAFQEEMRRKEGQQAEQDEEREGKAVSNEQSSAGSQPSADERQEIASEQQSASESQSEAQSNTDQWSQLLQSVGLDGMSDIGRNLPYVIATLPDMLVGLFTGKTKSVGLKSELIPLASIVLGLFVKNPLLKLALIGMGGANLLNKMGHEAIDRQQSDQTQQSQQMRYRQYADQSLNPRIADPIMNGNTLIATIDNVPCSISVSEPAAAAYTAGALPLNTLANAVLAQYDRQQLAAQQSSRQIEIPDEQSRNRGLALR